LELGSGAKAFVVAGDEGKRKRKRKTRPSAYLFVLQKTTKTKPNLTPNPNLRGCVFFKECHMWSHSLIYLFIFIYL